MPQGPARFEFVEPLEDAFLRAAKTFLHTQAETPPADSPALTEAIAANEAARRMAPGVDPTMFRITMAYVYYMEMRQQIVDQAAEVAALRRQVTGLTEHNGLLIERAGLLESSLEYQTNVLWQLRRAVRGAASI